MNHKSESPAELHADHRLWQSELTTWQFDIQEWQSEHAAGREELKKIIELLRQHEKALSEHEDAVEAIGAGLEFHEKNLAASLRDRAHPCLDNVLLREHGEEADKFARQRAAHERIKKHHHIAMAHVASLKHALEAAM